MFVMDVPYVPAQDTTIVLVQATARVGGTSPAGVTAQPDYQLNACSEFSSGGGGGVSPADLLAVVLGNRSHRDIFDDRVAVASIKITLLQNPAHGKFIAEVDNTGVGSYLYSVEPGYLGNDRAIFMAEFEGKRYKVVINFVITEGINENPLLPGEEPVCPPPNLIKVNGKPVSGSSSYDLNSTPVTFEIKGARLQYFLRK